MKGLVMKMKHLQLLIKPVSSECNLRCSYCFYLDEGRNRSCPSYGTMSRETAQIIIEKALEAADDSCTFGFQGGEPMLAGLPYYETFIRLVEQARQKISCRRNPPEVRYVMQTNGTLLDERWTGFLKKNHFLTGISMDGTRAVHDAYRRDISGKGTFESVLAGARHLRDGGADVNVLCVLTAYSAAHIEAVYRFFKKEGLIFQQYIPCLDPMGKERGKEGWSLRTGLYAAALKKLFDLWFADLTAGTSVSIREFDNWLSMLRGMPPEACAWMGRCSIQHIIEADGGVYPCDFYVLDAYRIANVHEEGFCFSASWDRCRFFQEHDKRGDSCPSCKWYPLCRGGCARDYTAGPDGRRNYYCEAYRAFFPYAISRLEWLAARAAL